MSFYTNYFSREEILKTLFVPSSQLESKKLSDYKFDVTKKYNFVINVYEDDEIHCTAERFKDTLLLERFSYKKFGLLHLFKAIKKNGGCSIGTLDDFFNKEIIMSHLARIPSNLPNEVKNKLAIDIYRYLIHEAIGVECNLEINFIDYEHKDSLYTEEGASLFWA